VGLFGPVVDIANAALPGTTYQITFGVCALLCTASLVFVHGTDDRAATADARAG
jgi:hypothetical protein